MDLPNLTPEQVDLYLKLIGGVLAAVTTVVVGTLLPAIRNFKTAQAAAPAQASSDMVTAAAKLAASVAMEALGRWTKQAAFEKRGVTPADHDRALSEGITEGLKMLVSSGIWPTIMQHYTRETLLAALKGYIEAKVPSPVVQRGFEGGVAGGAITPEMEKLLANLPSLTPGAAPAGDVK
jgi:hypothetical protein